MVPGSWQLQAGPADRFPGAILVPGAGGAAAGVEYVGHLPCHAGGSRCFCSICQVVMACFIYLCTCSHSASRACSWRRAALRWDRAATRKGHAAGPPPASKATICSMPQRPRAEPGWQRAGFAETQKCLLHSMASHAAVTVVWSNDGEASFRSADTTGRVATGRR